MNKLKIMYLHSGLNNSSGGTKFVFELIEELSKNHSVSLYLQKEHTYYQEEFKKIGVNVVALSDCSTGDFKFWITFSSQIKKQITFLKKESKNFDVVISSMFPMNILANSINLPHVQECFQPFAFFWDPILINSMSLPKRIFLKILKRKFGYLDLEYTKKSQVISAPLPEVCDYIYELYGKESNCRFCGIKSDFFKPTPSNLSKKYGDKKIIIHGTDWSGNKNTDWLVTQFIEISKKFENVVLVITEYANGPERKKVLKKIKKFKLNVIIEGLVPQESLPKHYSIATLGIYPGVAHKKSAAGLWILECLSCGIPIIRPNNTEIEGKHNHTGFLYDSNNPSEFQDYVLTILRNDELREKFSKNARNFITTERTWKKTADIFIENCLNAITLFQRN